MLWCHSMMELVAMIEAFRLMKNQQIMPSWHLPSQAHQVLQGLIMRKSQFDVLSYKSGLESVEARLVVYQQNKNVFEEDIKLLKLDVMLRDNALVELRKKFEKVDQERDELKLKLENFQTSLKNLSLLPLSLKIRFLTLKMNLRVKENQENDKIGSKPDKNRKRGEAGKGLKKLQ
nr:hypothetical protein [Tanacetum cinerariifolium]